MGSGGGGVADRPLVCVLVCATGLAMDCEKVVGLSAATAPVIPAFGQALSKASKKSMAYQIQEVSLPF